MPNSSVLRITAQADLDEAELTLEHAREYAAEGDVDYAWLLEGWERGRVLVARLQVTAYVAAPDGDVERVGAENHGIWLEVDVAPAVERQVSEIAPKDLPVLARRLRERGIELQASDLEHMFIHVELDERLHAALAGVQTRPDAERPKLR